MTRTVSDDFKRAVNAQTTSEAFILLVTLEHDSFTAPIRICNDPKQLLTVANVRGVESRGDEYIFVPFTVVLPSDDDTGISRITLTLDNIGREYMDDVRSATGPIQATFEIVLASDVDAVEITYSNFRMASLTYNAMTIEADFTLDYYGLEPFPAGDFNPSDFPGMF